MIARGTCTQPEAIELIAAVVEDREREAKVLRLLAETTLLRAKFNAMPAPPEHYEHALIRAIGLTCREMGICARLSTVNLQACLKGEPS